MIKLLLSKWGILSVAMQRAIQDDQKVYDEDGEGTYGDNKPDMWRLRTRSRQSWLKTIQRSRT